MILGFPLIMIDCKFAFSNERKKGETRGEGNRNKISNHNKLDFPNYHSENREVIGVDQKFLELYTTN